MTIIGEVFLRVSPDTKGFESELQKTAGTAGAKVAKTLATALGGAFVLTKIKGFAQAGIEELKAAAAVQAQTEAAIKSTGGAANVTSEQVGNLSSSLLKVSGVDDELIQKGANLLLTFTRVRNEVGEGNDIFNQATEAALDLSRAGFGSVESASVLLGKALNDPVAGLTALQRVGVRLTESQKETVRQLVATGDVLGAQKVILEEVNVQVGGSAEAFGNTLPGKLEIAQQSLENTRGALVAGMAPALAVTADAATFLTEQFAKQPPQLQAVEGGLILVVGALGSIITPLKSGIDLWRSFSTGAQAAAAATDAAKFSNSAAAVGDLYTSTSRAATAMKVLGGAAVIAVAGFGIKQLIDFERQLGEIEVDADNLATALAGIGPDQDELEKFVAVADAAGELDDVVRQTAETNLIAAGRLVDYAEAHGFAKGEIDALRGIVEDEAAAQAQANAEHEASARIVGETGTTAAIAAGGVGELAGATGELGDAAADTGEELVTYEDRLQEARDAVEALFDTTTSSIDSQFAYRDSVNAVEDALEDKTQLEKDGKTFTEEYTRAVDAAEEALYAQSEAATEAAVKQVELAGGTADASAKAQIQVAELKKLRDQVGPNSTLGQRLQGHIDALNRIPRSKSTTVDVLTGAAMVKLDRLARRINDILRAANSPIRISTGGGGGIPLAAGGIVPGHYTEAGYFATGGGPRGTDIIPAWLTPGEFVMRKQAVDRLGPGLLEALNGGAFPAVASAPVTIRETPIVQNISTSDPIAAAGEAARRGRAVRLALSLRG